MNRMAIAFLAMVLGAGMVLSSTVRAGEEGEKPKRERGGGDKGGGDKGGGDRGAGGRGAWQQGGGFGGPGGIQNMLGGQRNIVSMASRMLGMDIEDPKAGPKIDSLPLGAEKRMVMYVPVGGVDNFSGNGQGWKVESIFKFTDEQTKAVDALREEYKTEQKKLEQEILDQQKALAEKVKALRHKYELRANDVLTGDDKTAKEKMDALAKETNDKNAAVVAETLPLFDQNDMMQGIALMRTIREKTTVNIKSAEEKLVELVPAENRARIQEVIKTQEQIREQTNRFMQGGGGGPGGAGGRGRGGDGPQKPPAPPDAAEKKDF